MLPDLTHLQFLILGSLTEGEQSGREIRARLAEQGVKKSGPAFYQLMARLEDSKYVRGWYDQKVIDGQVIKERRYKITAPGLRALEATATFYRQQQSRLDLAGGLANG
jgi:DNA-binding PadR family transcriptional regulator